MYADRLFNALERNDPVPGQLLVAAPDTLMPHFNRSVILIGEQDAGRTFGVDLTKRSEVALFNVMPEWLPLAAKPQALYVGGPQNDRNVAGVAMTRQGVDIDKEPALTRLAPRLAYVDLRVGPDELSPLVESMRLFAGCFIWEARRAGRADRARRVVRCASPASGRPRRGQRRRLGGRDEAPAHAAAAVFHLPPLRG